MLFQHTKKFTLLQWVQTLSVFFLLAVASVSFAQPTADEHAAHHPGEKEKEGEGMSGMMKNIGTPSKELYPSLMSLPTLSPEKRLAIQQKAHQRITSGMALMKGGLNELLLASNNNDYAKMQEALEKLREGIAQYESALAALRALSEGKNPSDIALQWFKREMNLLPSSPQAESVLGGPFFHLTIIALFGLFFLVMIWMYFFKMRRAAALLDRLTKQNAAVSSQTPPQFSKAPEPTPSLTSVEPIKSSQVSKVPSETAPTMPPTCPAHKCPVPQFPVMRSLTEPEEKWEGQLRVCRIFQEAPGIKTYHLASTHEVALPFTYYPGQFITLTALINGKTIRRSYTMASTPTQLHYCAITVKREEQGLFSRYLHDEIKEGDLLEVMGPNGKFTFTGEEAKSIVLICGGVGITPMMSIIRYLTDIGWHNDIYLLYCCRTTSEFLFREELEQLQERYLNLHVYASMLRSEGTIWMGLQGLFTKNIISHLVPDIASHHIHVCGPPAMMEAILGSLKELKVPADLILTEAFGPEKKPEIAQEDLVTIKAETRAMISFRKSEKMVPILPDCTLLEIAEANGIAIDNACRTGQCGLCKVTLLSGEVTMACEDALSKEDKQQGLILACQAKATQNIEVDA